jgi:hypothetical protein
MKYDSFLFISFFTVLSVALLAPADALATQAHGAPEGIYAHQLAHIFFIISMGFLIHWLRERKLVNNSGWRFIQYAAFFLICWNIDAFTVHLLADQLGIIQIKKIGAEHIQINAVNAGRGFATLYYIAKLDHLLCVPALCFLYFGLRRLVKEDSASIVTVEVSKE